MATSLGELVVQLGVDAKAMSEGLDAATKKIKDVGSSLTTAGAALTKTVTLPIIAAGTALVAVGNQFDKASDTIRAGTGATGQALRDLEADFRAVFQAVPAGAEVTAKVIADLNTRTGTTGQALQTLARQIIELSNLTGTDAATNVANLTRVFGDWSVATEEQAVTIDMLFRASQQTGIGVDELGQKVVQFGAPLRQMGFTLEESVALLGKWEKEGVNTEAVLGALKIGVAKFAAEGLSGKEAMAQFIAEVQALGPGAEATALAVEKFGSRAGPDMVAAVLEGRFAIEDYVDTITNGSDTVLQAAEDTRSLGENFQIMKNAVATAVEPLGTLMVDALSRLQPHIETVVGWIEQAVNWFMNLPAPVQATIGVLVGVLAAIGPLLVVAGQLIGAIAAIAPAFALAGSAIGGISAPVLVAVGVIAGLVAAVVDLWRNNEEFREAVMDIWESISEIIGGAVENLRVVWNEWGDEIMTVAGAVWDQVKVIIQSAVRIITEVIRLALNVVTGDWDGAWEALKGIADAALDAVVGVVKAQWKIMETLFGGLKDTVVEIVEKMWEAIKREFSDAVREVGEKAEAVKNAVEAPFRKLADIVVNRSIVPDMVRDVVAEFEKMRGETEAKVDRMVASVIEKMTGFSVAASKVTDAGGRIIENLILQTEKAALSEEAYRRLELSLQGVTGAEQDTIIQMEAHLKVLDEEKRATDENAKAVQDLVADLGRQRDGLMLSADAALDLKIATLELTDEQRKNIDALRDQIWELEFQRNAKKLAEQAAKDAAKAEEEHAKAVEDAKGRITDSLKNLVEGYLPSWATGWAGHWQTAKDVFTVFEGDLGGILGNIMSMFEGWIGKLGGIFGQLFGWLGDVLGLSSSVTSAVTNAVTGAATTAAAATATGSAAGAGAGGILVTDVFGGGVIGGGTVTTGVGGTAAAGGGTAAGAGGVGTTGSILGGAAGAGIALGGPVAISYAGEGLLNLLGRDTTDWVKETWGEYGSSRLRQDYDTMWREMIENEGKYIYAGGIEPQPIVLEVDGRVLGEVSMKYGVQSLRESAGVSVY